jgi:MOSC domain-containing protein YiiM
MEATTISPPGRVLAICTSPGKGHSKHPVERGVLRAAHGLEGDAHAGRWHRQLSLLALSDIEWMRARSRIDLRYGSFAENFVLDGVDFSDLRVGTRLWFGSEAEIEITQIGKECHAGCAISRQVGTCIMPTRGRFARVLRGGEIGVGDLVTLQAPAPLHSQCWGILPHQSELNPQTSS